MRIFEELRWLSWLTADRTAFPRDTSCGVAIRSGANGHDLHISSASERLRPQRSRIDRPRHPVWRVRFTALAHVTEGIRQAARPDPRRSVTVPARARAADRRPLRRTDRGYVRGVRGSWSPTKRRTLGLELQIALEPQACDTLAAVTLAACLAARRDPEAIVLVVPSDHLIPDVEAFQAAVAKAASAGEGSGQIVVLGVDPTWPSTAFGYIAMGEPIGQDGARSRPFCREAGRGDGRGADR